MDARIADLTILLYWMDATQQKTDDAGEREIAWYYFRDQIEDAMGLQRGDLDSTCRPRGAQPDAVEDSDDAG
jgi:hypothetical protein